MLTWIPVRIQKVEGLGFGIWGLGFRAWGLGSRSRISHYRVPRAPRRVEEE